MALDNFSMQIIEVECDVLAQSGDNMCAVDWTPNRIHPARFIVVHSIVQNQTKFRAEIFESNSVHV